LFVLIGYCRLYVAFLISIIMEKNLDSNTQTYSISPRFLYILFLLSVGIWCFLIIAAPLLAKTEHSLISGFIYFCFSNICHQIPERSFFLFGKQLAVCSRCTGLYFGFLIGTILYPIVFKLNRVKIPSRKYLILASIPIGIDILIRTLHIAENSFISRLISGLILGVMTVFFVVPGILYFSNHSHKNFLQVIREKKIADDLLNSTDDYFYIVFFLCSLTICGKNK